MGGRSLRNAADRSLSMSATRATDASECCYGVRGSFRRFDLIRHIWTVGLFIVAGCLCVILPYDAVVAHSWRLWLVVFVGLGISFVCSASELAFALACGEGSDSHVYKKNVARSKELLAIVEDPATSETDKAAAVHEAARLQRILEIGQRYASHHNPTLVVANNTAITIVAVLSGLAFFATSNPEMVGHACRWSASMRAHQFPALLPEAVAAIGEFLGHSLRCIEIFGLPVLPFPVNSIVFQSTLSLTMILFVGEIVPKQLGTTYPERMTHILFPIYRIVGWVFSFGTGPSFGAIGRQALRLASIIAAEAQRGAAAVGSAASSSWRRLAVLKRYIGRLITKR
jgi:hypothetical protein